MATGKASAKTVDFSNVKEAGQFAPRRVPAGDYAAKIVKVEDGKSSKDQEFQYIFTIKLTQFSQNSYPYYCKLQENQLWKLRNLLIAGGINVPKRKASVDPNRLVGKMIGVTMGDDEYDGKEKSTIEAVFPASELDDTAVGGDSEDDDESAYAEDDEDVADDDSDEDVEEDSDDEEEAGEDSDGFDAMDRAALKAYLKTRDPAFQAKKSQTDDDLRELARAAANDAGDDEEYDEEEPEPKPAPKKAKKGKKAKKQTEDEELEELDIDDL
jgi:hypothetical protein